MEGQRPAQERAEVIKALLTLATHDLEFLRDVRYAPASTLSRYGLTLRDAEMDGVFNYLTHNAGLSDAELVRDMEQFFSLEFRWH